MFVYFNNKERVKTPSLSYFEEGSFPLPPPDEFPVVLGAFTNPDISYPFYLIY